jgi:hypothetical protein
VREGGVICMSMGPVVHLLQGNKEMPGFFTRSSIAYAGTWYIGQGSHPRSRVRGLSAARRRQRTSEEWAIVANGIARSQCVALP